MKMNRIIWFAPLLFLWSCEFKSYEEHEATPYDGVFTYTEVSKNAAWKNRFDHAAVAFDGKIWVFGGYNPGEVRNDTYLEDVWSSEDGEIWELVTSEAPWHGRRGHTVNVFDDGNGEAMYLMGGFEVDEETGYRQYTNDVWKSQNGADWVQLKERFYPKLDSLDEFNQRVSPPLDSLDDWFPRMNHVALTATHNDTNFLYIIGGSTQLENYNSRYAMEYFSDVWRSTNGSDWTRVWNNDYGMRASHSGTVDPATGKIFIQGGMHGPIFDAEYNASRPNENWTWMWTSLDGKNWVAENDTANFDQAYLSRTEHTMEFFNNTLWTFSGSTTSLMHYQFTNREHYPTWRYDEGLWSVDSEGTAIKPRHSYATVIFQNKIWFLGGYTSNKGQNNDVWSAEL
jgi:hypothetical protein